MEDPKKDLEKIINDVEKKNNIPAGLINKIYEAEKEVVHWAIRDKVLPEIKNLIEESSIHYKNGNGGEE